VAAPGKGDERERGGGHRRIEDVINGQADHERHRALGERHERKHDDAHTEPYAVRAHVTEKPFQSR
jgi:hypothetical protein